MSAKYLKTWQKTTWQLLDSVWDVHVSFPPSLQLCCLETEWCFYSQNFNRRTSSKKEKMNKTNPTCPVFWRMLCQFVKAKSIFKTKYQTLMLGGNRQAHLFLPCKITVDTRGTLFQFALDQFLMRARRTFCYGKHISQGSLQLWSFS